MESIKENQEKILEEIQLLKKKKYQISLFKIQNFDSVLHK